MFASLSSAVSPLSNVTESAFSKSDVSPAAQSRFGEDFFGRAANVKFDKNLSAKTTDLIEQSPVFNINPFGSSKMLTGGPYNQESQNQFVIHGSELNPQDPPAVPPRRANYASDALLAPVYLQSLVADHLTQASSQPNATSDSIEAQSVSPLSHSPSVTVEPPSFQQPTNRNNEQASRNPFY